MPHGKHRPGYFKEYYNRPEIKKKKKEYEKLRGITEKRKEWSRIRRNLVMEFIRDFKKGKSCKRCGWKEHVEILQFHHKDPTKKEFKMSKGNIGNLSRERIIAEINKCELICPNCHFWLHYQETAKH